MTKISVVVPVYNTGEFLAECIDSILDQTLSDWELILVNDGSVDDSDAICRKYAQKDGRIHYFRQENQGVSAARNLGISKATGEYVGCVDSDDALDARFLETSYEKAIQESADIVLIGEWLLSRLPFPAALPSWGYLVRKSFLDKYPDVRYPVGIQPCEDGLVSHQLLALTDKIAFNPNGVYHYRQHERGNHHAINKACGKVLAQIPKWLGILTDFYDKYQLWDGKARHLLRFLEHEPFELRFCAMPFDQGQRQQLFAIIHDFYGKKLAPRLTTADMAILTGNFRRFLEASDFQSFEESCARVARKRKILLLLTRLIPVATVRRQLKTKIKAMQ